MSAASASSERRRILLVDDVELNRVLTEAVLRSATYEVESVGDGAAALAALEKKSYDLVLLDLEMPGLDGHEAAAAIRRREAETASGRRVKLASISARSEAASRLRSIEVGMAAHIARPIAPHELVRQIELVVGQALIESEPGPWQRECYEEWASRLGDARMTTFLLSLLDHFRELQALLATEDAGEPVHRLAHDVASTGGMLGFLEVTRGCRGLLEAVDAAAADTARAGLAHALTRSIGCLDRHFADSNQADAA